MRFVIQYHPARANFLETMTDAESGAVGAHFSYLSRLLEQGQLIFAGRRTDAAFGLAVFDAESEEAARAVVANDPVVKAGVFRATVGQFSFALVNPSALQS